MPIQETPEFEELALNQWKSKGGTLWILGSKTELPGDSTHTAAIIDTEFGGKTELLGGLIFIRPVTPLPTDQAAFMIYNSQASLIYAVSAIDPTGANPPNPNVDFKIQIEEGEAGVYKTLTSDEIQTQIAAPPFSISRKLVLIVPLYSSKRQ